MILKAILFDHHFCSFVAIIFIVSLLMKTDSTVICVPCRLSMFVISHFVFEKLQIWKISYVNWLKFVYCLNFRPLRPDLSK